jgi:hypothetical protein
LTTDHQKRANRANAKSSTGPRTTAGKARAAQNALRHGLNVPIWADPALVPIVEVIARRIAGPKTDAAALEHADGSLKPKSTSSVCVRIVGGSSSARSRTPITGRSGFASFRPCSWQSKVDSAGLLVDHLCSGELRK